VIALALPEIGPSLGVLAAPPASRDESWIPVDDLRLELANRLFKLAGSARIGGQTAPEIITAAAWGSAWHQTVAAVAARVAATVDRRLQQAAEASRYPKRRLKAALVTPADLRAITARLGEGGAGLEAGLEELERARGALSPPAVPGHDPTEEWIDRVAAAARRQESAWRELHLALGREEPIWTREFEAVRRWRRPRWPLWTAAALIYGVAIWAGLVLGGYVPAPAPLTGPVSWLWERF